MLYYDVKSLFNLPSQSVIRCIHIQKYRRKRQEIEAEEEKQVQAQQGKEEVKRQPKKNKADAVLLLGFI
jgi:hypothetical protein